MERVRLASSKQHAASSKQAAPQGPFPAPEQQGSQNQEKNVTTLSGMFSRNFLGKKLFSGRTLKWSETVIYWSFGPCWATGS